MKGSKYEATRGLSLPHIGKLIEADIKFAVAQGLLPKGLKAAVVLHVWESGCPGLHVFVRGTPLKTDKGGRLNALSARTSKVLWAIQDAYNFTSGTETRFAGAVAWGTPVTQ